MEENPVLQPNKYGISGKLVYGISPGVHDWTMF